MDLAGGYIGGTNFADVSQSTVRIDSVEFNNVENARIGVGRAGDSTVSNLSLVATSVVHNPNGKPDDVFAGANTSLGRVGRLSYSDFSDSLVSIESVTTGDSAADIGSAVGFHSSFGSIEIDNTYYTNKTGNPAIGDQFTSPQTNDTTSVTVAEVTGESSSTSLSKLDFDTVWRTTSGYPSPN